MQEVQAQEVLSCKKTMSLSIHPQGHSWVKCQRGRGSQQDVIEYVGYMMQQVVLLCMRIGPSGFNQGWVSPSPDVVDCRRFLDAAKRAHIIVRVFNAGLLRMISLFDRVAARRLTLC